VGFPAAGRLPGGGGCYWWPSAEEMSMFFQHFRCGLAGSGSLALASSHACGSSSLRSAREDGGRRQAAAVTSHRSGRRTWKKSSFAKYLVVICFSFQVSFELGMYCYSLM